MHALLWVFLVWPFLAVLVAVVLGRMIALADRRSVGQPPLMTTADLPPDLRSPSLPAV